MTNAADSIRLVSVMHIHFCGDLVHDVPMLILWAVSFAPDWVPSVGALRARLREMAHG